MNQISHLKKWSLCGLLSAVFACAGLASDALFQNDTVLTYAIPPEILPTINATNFVNNNTFDLTFNAAFQGFNAETFEPGDTMNYTNNGLMVATSSILTNFGGNLFLALDFSPGCGFTFDHYSTQTGLRSPASSFYNAGTIRANSLIDLTNNFFLVSTVGKCIINATNVASPGTIQLGLDSLLHIDGSDVDLSRSTVTLEDLNAFLLFFFFGNVALSPLDFGVGTDTFADWDPSAALQPNFALSSLFISQSFFINQMLVDPSTPYFHEDDEFDPTTFALTHRLVRAVFLNNNPGDNVAANVYFGGNPIPFLGSGFVTVGWAGSYRDPLTGAQLTNYLYLNDFYLRGANTNNPIFNGVPSNFTFTELTTPATFGVAPATTAFPIITPPGIVTNNYSYTFVQLSPLTVATNASELNPSGALTNLPGRVEINASHALDLSMARITGPNYISLTCTNQFVSATGAQISVPLADINLGVTNGFMVFSNVLEPSLPNFGGTVQAWSSDWVTVDSAGVTNEYRILLVNANLNSVSPSQVQNLTLHATNDLTISDILNVFGQFSIDARNLTLTTNGPLAACAEGELNLQNDPIRWETSVRYLHNLTNNGAIRLRNSALFGVTSTNIDTITNVIPDTAATAASGTLSEIGGRTNVTSRSVVTIYTNKYYFTLKITNTVPNQVKIATTFDATMNNLIAAINHGPGAGTNYSSATPTNLVATAGPLASHEFTVTSKILGTTGNFIASTYAPATNKSGTISSNLTWNGHVTLFGGANAVSGSTNVVVVPTVIGGRYGTIVNNGFISDQGSAILVDDFLSSGVFSNAVGSFNLSALDAAFTNGQLTAQGDVSIAASTILISNLFIEADRSLTLAGTNLLTDTGTASSNIWIVGLNSAGKGISTPVKPPVGDLLGTTITNYAPANRNVLNVWAGQDRGTSVAGYADNLAVGRLILDGLGAAPSTQFTFQGATANNALYIDYFELRDGATNTDIGNNFLALNINTNMVIYYAQAFMNGVSIAQKMNHKNGDRLRWVPQYVGAFSSVQVLYPDGTTNTFNAALAARTDVDSDGDGIPNASDSTPFFTPSEIDLTVVVTNLPPMTALIQWHSIPSATNQVFYATNISSPTWLLLTNFVSPPNVPPLGGWPITNVVQDVVNLAQPRYYNVTVTPNSTQFYGP